MILFKRADLILVTQRQGYFVNAFEQALALHSTDAKIYFAYANFIAGQSDYKKAATLLRTAADKTQDHNLLAEIHSNLGEFLRSDKKYDEAIAAHRRALNLRPGDATIEYNLATALQDAEQLVEAESIFRRLVKAQPDMARAKVNLGMLYKKQNRFDEAMHLFEEALYLDDSLSQTYANIGAVFAEKGWITAGLLLHEHALALKDTDIRIFGKPTSRKYRRLGVALALGNSVANARKKARECAHRVKIKY